MDRPTKGSLLEIGFIKLLLEASEARLTGMIRLESATIIKVVYMQQGGVAFASSNEKTDRLTEVLKRAGKLTPEQVEHAQARLKPNVSLGKTLVELGYINPKDLLWGARMQVEGILHQLLFWTQGTYQILEGPLPKEIVSLNMSVCQIVYDGILKTQDRQWVLDHIGSPEAVYAPTAAYHEKNAAYKLPVEETVSRMNGKRTLEEIAQASSQETFLVCKTAAALQLLGMVQPAVVEQPAPGAEPSIEVIVEPMQEEVAFSEPDIKPIAPRQDVSLGELMQIPTVAELQSQPAVQFPETKVEEEEQQEEEAMPPTLILPPAPPESILTPAAEPIFTAPQPVKAEVAPFQVIAEEPAVEEREDTENLPEAAPAPEHEPEPMMFEEEEAPAPTARIEPPSFATAARQSQAFPMESFTVSRKKQHRAASYPTVWNWKKISLLMAVLAVVAIGGTYLYTHLPFGNGGTQIPTPAVSKPAKPPAKEPVVVAQAPAKEAPAPAEVKQPKPAAAQPEPKPAAAQPKPAPAETKQKPAPAEPKPKPSTPASPPPAAASPQLGLVQSGRIADAAASWKKALMPHRSKYTVQLEIACQPNTVSEAFGIMSNASQLSVVPLDYKGQHCYRVLYGVYNSPADAEAARGRLPQEFLKQQSPAQVIPLSKALK